MKVFHSGYFVKMSKEFFTAEDYSNVAIKNLKLKLQKENYVGNNWFITWEYSQQWDGLEFLINCESVEVAQNVLDLVYCCATTIQLKPIFDGMPHSVFEKGKFLVDFKAESSPSIPEYFYFASIVSKSQDFTNAVTKFELCSSIYSQHPIEISEIEWKTTNYSYIQIRFAYAITIAYSVIEELGLDIRVKLGESSFINKEWNPRVLNDLKDRLVARDINLNDDVVWLIRGPLTKVELNRPIKIIKLTEWAKETLDYPDDTIFLKQDAHVTIPDAISYVSFLRSKMSSHKVNERIYQLSVFDVYNAQYLARKLILDSTGMLKELLLNN